MASFVKASDIISIAVEIERRGREFYLALAAQAGSSMDSAFYTRMADEETVHEGIFKQMLDRAGGVDIPADATTEEYMHYVSDIIESHCLFAKGNTEFAVVSPVGQAIQLEKDTLLYFMAMEAMVPEAEQHFIRACADEERKHLRSLMSLYKQ